MKMRTVYEPEFAAYGRVIKGYDTQALKEAMLHTPLPEDVVYVASVPELEALPVAGELAEGIYGQMPIQIGYCNGHNKKLNALEYHRDSEINMAVTDLVLLIGKQQDIADDFTYDTSLVEAFFVPAGTQEGGFRCVVVLPKGTNGELEGTVAERCGEERLLFARNKWLVGHKEGGLPENAWLGLRGENITLD